MAPRLGLDIGGTKLAVGVVASGGSVIARRRLPTAEAGDGEDLLRRLAALAEEACAEAGLNPTDLDGVGLALPGPVDPSSQRLLMAPSLPRLTDFPVRPFFARHWGRNDPGWVCADNDANAAALGEALYGAGRGARLVCYFTVSTGIGGGVVVSGRLFRGATGQAGEFGHLKLRADEPPCACGDRGCLEALASGTAIGRRGRAMALRDGGALLALARLDTAAPSAAQVAEAVREGDAVAMAVWSAAMADLGAGVATVINLFNPDVVVLGGGVCRSADLVLPAVRAIVADRAMPMLAAACRIESAALGDDVGIVGAAALLDEPKSDRESCDIDSPG
jgi:glucokinase